MTTDLNSVYEVSQKMQSLRSQTRRKKLIKDNITLAITEDLYEKYCEAKFELAETSVLTVDSIKDIVKGHCRCREKFPFLILLVRYLSFTSIRLSMLPASHLNKPDLTEPEQCTSRRDI